jgi:Uma2 family endonuclease
MAIAVPPAGTAPERYTVERYFALVDEGVLGPDDSVELLEGVIVAMAPSGPPHAGTTSSVAEALRDALGKRVLVREEKCLILGRYSAPEPDVAVVPRTESRYADTHPQTAHLVIEVADSSLAQDRITKAAIYAAAAIPEYWIVDLRHDRVEVFRSPEPQARRYAERRIAERGQLLDVVAFPDARVRVDDILPPRPAERG